jgi:DNA-binding Lrp family transcriptional regulator
VCSFFCGLGANFLGRPDVNICCGDGFMPMAFVLINTEIGSESEVLDELKKIDAVKEAYMVYGVYDVVAKVGANTMDKLKEIVTWNVRRLDKVRSTLTMIVIEGQQ